MMPMLKKKKVYQIPLKKKKEIFALYFFLIGVFVFLNLPKCQWIITKKKTWQRKRRWDKKLEKRSIIHYREREREYN